MNDLQLLMLIAAVFQTQKPGTNFNDSITLAENIIEECIKRQNRHASKHRGNPDQTCFQCRVNLSATETIPRVIS